MLILVVPIVVVLLFLFAIIALCKKWKTTSALSLLCCIILNAFSQTFALHPFATGLVNIKSDDVLRVMTYNIHDEGDSLGGRLDEFVKSIDKKNIDVLVLCEVDTPYKSAVRFELNKVFSHYSYLKSHSTSPTQVFSKYPVTDIYQFEYHDENGIPKTSGTWLMNLHTPQGEVKFTACHFSSNRDGLKEKPTGSFISWLPTNGELVESLKLGYIKRGIESETLRDSLNKYDIPKIVVGDFNDIGGSYTVRQIIGNDLSDAWWEGGFGFGFTYDMYHLLLRLDHVFYSDKDIELVGVKVLNDWKYSDHYPLVADLRIKS